MNTPTTLTVEGTIHFGRKGRGAPKVLQSGPEPLKPVPGRVPRVSRLMALAIRFDRLIRDGVIEDYSDLARLGRVTPARASQIMRLLHLATDIQEALLCLPPVENGRDPIVLRDLQPIVTVMDWKKQRKLLAELLKIRGKDAR
jgi:hypothetical protein